MTLETWRIISGQILTWLPTLDVDRYVKEIILYVDGYEIKLLKTGTKNFITIIWQS
jgi:hypothetical protein